MSLTIIFPLFEECKKFTLDQFWKDQFTNCACNRFPVGIKYDPVHKNMILKLDGKKTEVFAVSENPKEVFQVMMKIFREKLNMKSTRDLKIQRDDLNETLSKKTVDLDCEWKKIKPKNLRNQLLSDFIARLKSEYELSKTETSYLISLIQLGFQFKALSHDDVNYENGEIQNIKGLDYDENLKKFVIPDYPNIYQKTEKSSNTNKVYTAIDRFVRDNNFRINKFKE